MATIKDIAERVGVSPTTVSRVLNYDSSLSVSEVKRRQIIETAEELNYAPPRMRGKRRTTPEVASGPICLMHVLAPNEELADPYYITIRHSIEKRLSEVGLKISHHFSAERTVPDEMMNGGGAVIVIGPHVPNVVNALADSGVPTVLVDYPPHRHDVDCVYPDLDHAMDNLLDALWERGLRTFGFIGARWGPDVPTRPSPEIRYQAFLNWVGGRKIAAPNHILLKDMSPYGGFDLTRQLLSDGHAPEVLVAANDTMAIGAIRAAASLELRVPDDLRIVGFNDIPAAALVDPGLTTVAIPADEIGRAAVDLLLERIAGREFSKRVILGTRIVWRESC